MKSITMQERVVDDCTIPLILRMARRDEAAFSRFYDCCGRRVYALALHILKGDTAAAEEAALDAMNQGWQNAARFDPDRGTGLAWMLTIARTRALDALRARLRHTTRESALDTAFELSAPEPDPLQSAAAADSAAAVRRAVAELPDAQRAAIEAAYFGGLSYTETARQLGEPEGTVKTRIRAGMRTLRELLAGGTSA